MRSRRTRLETMAEEGAARRSPRPAPGRATSATTSPPARSGSRWPRSRIGALGEPAIAHLLEPLLGPALGHTAAVAISVIIAYLLITVAQTIVGEMVPKLYVIQHAEGVARRIARPLQFFRMLFHPFIVAAELRRRTRLLRMLGTDPDAEPEGGHARGAQAADRPVHHRRPARRRRGEHAHRRLPPPRAGGPSGDDADPGGRHGRRLRDRRGGAAALRLRPATRGWS